jgi:hypothetical protein
VHLTHPTIDAVLERVRPTRDSGDETTIRIDVGIATVFHLSRCLFEQVIDPWIGYGDPEMSEAVEERFILILRALTLGLDPGAAAGGRRDSSGGPSGPG